MRHFKGCLMYVFEDSDQAFEAGVLSKRGCNMSEFSIHEEENDINSFYFDVSLFSSVRFSNSCFT